MSRVDLKGLRHRDPAVRIETIKAAARARDRRALRQLAVMCEDDADAEVRSVARRAGVFIRKELGELPPHPEEQKPDGKPVEIPVQPKDATNARELVNAAMSYQINSEKAKAIKSLEKALRLNPNLRHDGFFVSLAETLTNAEGEAAVNIICDAQQQASIAAAETHQREEIASQAHLQETSRVRWIDVGFDLALYSALVAVCAFVTFFLVVQSAQRYTNQVEENRVAVAAALRTGSFTEQNGERIYQRVNEDGETVTFTAIQPNLEFLRQVTGINAMTIGQYTPTILIFSVLSGAVILLMSAAAHTISTVILRGSGTLRYLSHRVAGLFTSRTIILFVLLWVGTIIVFEFEGGVTISILAGAVSIFLLLVFVKYINIVSAAYRVSMPRGLVAASVGMLPAVLISGIGSMFILF